MHAVFVALLAIGHAAKFYPSPALQRHAMVLGNVQCSDNMTFEEYLNLDGDRLASFSVRFKQAPERNTEI